MRIIRFDLTAYGPFTDTSLDLSEGREGFHIIYGPNEAGKSCALRGLTALFYGIPFQTADNFLHENKNLRLGARIRNTTGEEISFVRRKGKKDTLLDEKGMSLPDSLLQRYLGGVTDEIFLQMFGFDHRRLIEGGRQLVLGGGRVGESLFSAGTGISNLHQVLRDLTAEAGGLFRSSGQIPLINRLIREYKEAKDKVAAKALSGREWDAHDRALREAKAGQKKGKTELDGLRKEQQRLLRMKEAFPIIKEREDYLKEHDNYSYS